MESFFGRYKNPLVLMGVLFIQFIALATQVKRPLDPKVPNSPGTRLIRVWTVTAFTPIERAFVGTGHFFRNGWHNYVDLRDVRKQNQQLQTEITQMRMEQTRLKEDADQAHRLQALLGFKEKFITQTLAAQVIGTSGSELSHVIYIDKGSHDGVKPDMAVITPDGIVGKIKDVFPLSAQVLMINDRDSGAGVILEKSRLQGVLKGTALGEVQLDGVMADEKIDLGERVIASGGDRIYPKGMPVGTVANVETDKESGSFLIIKIKPAADLNRLEEVLVVTKMAEQEPETAGNEGRVRAADILAQRLPGVSKSDQQAPAAAAAASAQGKKKTPTNSSGGNAAPAKAKPKKLEAPPEKNEAAPQATEPPASEEPKKEEATPKPPPPGPPENPPQ